MASAKAAEFTLLATPFRIKVVLKVKAGQEAAKVMKGVCVENRRTEHTNRQIPRRASMLTHQGTETVQQGQQHERGRFVVMSVRECKGHPTAYDPLPTQHTHTTTKLSKPQAPTLIGASTNTNRSSSSKQQQQQHTCQLPTDFSRGVRRRVQVEVGTRVAIGYSQRCLQLWGDRKHKLREGSQRQCEDHASGAGAG